MLASHLTLLEIFYLPFLWSTAVVTFLPFSALINIPDMFALFASDSWKIGRADWQKKEKTKPKGIFIIELQQMSRSL